MSYTLKFNLYAINQFNPISGLCRIAQENNHESIDFDNGECLVKLSDKFFKKYKSNPELVNSLFSGVYLLPSFMCKKIELNHLTQLEESTPFKVKKIIFNGDTNIIYVPRDDYICMDPRLLNVMSILNKYDLNKFMSDLYRWS